MKKLINYDGFHKSILFIGWKMKVMGIDLMIVDEECELEEYYKYFLYIFSINRDELAEEKNKTLLNIINS